MTQANTEATEAMYNALGKTAVVALDAFTFSCSMAVLTVYAARWWQSRETTALFDLEFLARLVLTLLIISAWVYALKRWFGYLRWPRWWAFPYVLVVLVPWAWLFARRLGMGGDSVCLFLLQSPVTITYVWRAHTRAKELTGRR